MYEPELDLDRTDLSDAISRAQPDLLPRASAGPKVGMSLRLGPEVMKQLLNEAAQRGIGHTVLAQELIEAGLAAMHADQAMVPLADVQRALAQIARRATSPATSPAA
jgi:hypothetical protein